MDYKCGFCATRFSREPTKTARGVNPNGSLQRGRGVVSDQVRCPGCGNLIPTWNKPRSSHSKSNSNSARQPK